MSQGYVPLRTRALHMLMDAGSWVAREDLDALSTSPLAIDDCMADLVVTGLAEWRKNVGYRLSASLPVRMAAQLQRKSGKPHAAAGVSGKDFYSVGVAETLPELGLVLYELQMPNPQPGPDALAQFQGQVQGVLNFINSRGDQHA